jgi:phage repressor protein C with HTH and peptisase S24 domain
MKEFAENLGLKRSTIIGYEEGTSPPSAVFLSKISEIYNVNINWLLNGIGEMFLSGKNNDLAHLKDGYKIPLLHQKVSCGAGVNWIDEQNIKGYIDVFSIVPRHTLERLFALSVEGNSMVGAGIKNGDYVLFCPEDDQYLDDNIYVFSLDGDVYCKQLEFDRISKTIKIYSIRVADLEKAELLTTLNIEDADFADRFRIFGRVFSWIHPNFSEK